MSNPYLDLAKAHAALLQQQLPLWGEKAAWPAPEHPEPAPDAPIALIFSPHPDDECVVGALPLRLMRECGYRIVNLPVTLGSNPRRQEERRRELAHACHYLGFECTEIEPDGFSHITAHAREKMPEEWAEKVEAVAAFIAQLKPALVICPNDNDGHATHIGTHHLVIDALAHEGHTCWLAFTEFWGAAPHPTLLLETSIKDTADLLAALSCHSGEVKRNPLHLRLPSWMADNVRRGGELIGGIGGTVPDFSFGTLYQLARFDGENLLASKQRHIITQTDNPLEAFTS